MFSIAVIAYADVTLENGSFQVLVNESTGRFGVVTKSGSMSTPADDGLVVLDTSTPPRSFAKIKIDGEVIKYASPVNDFNVAPRLSDDGKAIVSQWEYKNIAVGQRISFEDNPLSPGNETMIAIEYQIINLDETAHEIGMRILLDTLGESDKGNFLIPGALERLDKERSFEGEGVPDMYLMVDRPGANASYWAAGVFSDTVPDKLVFAGYDNMFVADYDYAIDTKRGFRKGLDEPDSGVAYFWKPQTFAPKTIGTIRILIGALEVTSFDGSDLGIDGFVTALQDTHRNRAQVVGLIENTGQNSLKKITLAINETSGGAAIKGAASSIDINRLSIGQSYLFSQWSITPLMDVGSAEYTVSFTGKSRGEYTTTVQRSVNFRMQEGHKNWVTDKEMVSDIAGYINPAFDISGMSILYGAVPVIAVNGVSEPPSPIPIVMPEPASIPESTAADTTNTESSAVPAALAEPEPASIPESIAADTTDTESSAIPAALTEAEPENIPESDATNSLDTESAVVPAAFAEPEPENIPESDTIDSSDTETVSEPIVVAETETTEAPKEVESQNINWTGRRNAKKEAELRKFSIWVKKAEYNDTEYWINKMSFSSDEYGWQEYNFIKGQVALYHLRTEKNDAILETYRTEYKSCFAHAAEENTPSVDMRAGAVFHQGFYYYAYTYNKSSQQKGINYFEQVRSMGKTKWWEEATYYLALTYKKLGDRTNARKYLQELIEHGNEGYDLYAPDRDRYVKSRLAAEWELKRL